MRGGVIECDAVDLANLSLLQPQHLIYRSLLEIAVLHHTPISLSGHQQTKSLAHIHNASNSKNHRGFSLPPRFSSIAVALVLDVVSVPPPFGTPL